MCCCVFGVQNFLLILCFFSFLFWYLFGDQCNILNEAGSIKTFRSMNSLATSMATSMQTVNSDTSDKSTEVTHL